MQGDREMGRDLAAVRLGHKKFGCTRRVRVLRWLAGERDTRALNLLVAHSGYQRVGLSMASAQRIDFLCFPLRYVV